MNIRHALRQLGIIFFLAITLATTVTQSAVDMNSALEQVRAFSRPFEFDFWGWTFEAVWHKFQQESVNLPAYLAPENQKLVILAYLDQTRQVQTLESAIQLIFSNPDIPDPEQEGAPLQRQLREINTSVENLQPIAESILQRQVSQILADENLSVLGQVLPPVLFQSSPLPKALIVSPRDVIRQDANLSLNPELQLEEIITTEQVIADNLNVSTLITNIGGVGTYPTMINRTSDITWLTGVVSHEWTHNFLTLRPLGWNYNTNNDLRTMNETAASIIEEELKWKIIERYYPQFLPQPSSGQVSTENEQPDIPVFNFDFEMYVTRTRTDELLAAGDISQAEAYMEERRTFFYQNGYVIRRLNQAWFAFHSAYVNAPSTGNEGQTGAAGTDPVGPAVWQLYERSTTLANFLNRISWMTSFASLQEALKNE